MVDSLALSRYLKSKKNTPFEWGVNDCVTFTADYFKETTGIDLISEYRGYSTTQEANNITGGDLLAMVKIKLGEPKYNLSKAARGTVVWTKFESLGLIDDSGEKIAVMTNHGVRKMPLSHGVFYWGVICQQ